MPEAHVGMMVTPSVKLVRPLGEGGMGAVWVADHLALRTQVVVKFIANDLKDNKEATDRFSREAAAASQVKSPHVVQTFDHGFTPDGVPYIVMELLEGRDLGAFLDQEGKCSPQLALEIVVQLGRALDRAHEKGIIHRDIKPGNIFLCDGGRGEVFVKILDFGIAKGVDLPKADSTTKTGVMIGSPFYMSPEQILGTKNIDRRSDLWSVGVVAYEMLTGQKPFDAETMGGLAIRIHSEPLPVPSKANPQLPPAVDAWFQRACSRPAPDRFASGREMAEALASALGGELPPSVDVPRISGSSTGPNVDATLPATALQAGASTESGIERPAAGPTTRNRLIALSVFAAVLGLGTFGVATLMKGPARPAPAASATSMATIVAVPDTSSSLGSASSPSSLGSPGSFGSVALPAPRNMGLAPLTEAASAAPMPAAPVASASAAASVAGGRAPGRPHPNATPPAGKPAGSSPSHRPPLPSPSGTPPASTAHDIF